jgi:polyisoprenoid-binding protein YceI
MKPVLFAAVLALATPALAQAPVPAAPAWTADKAVSRVGFRAAMNGAGFDGRFSRWDARINFDPNNLKASKVVATIDVSSAATGDGARDEALPSSDWFDAKRHPRATFTTRSIAANGPGKYVAQGDLTLRGVTRPVSLPFTLAINGDVAKMSGSTVLDRTAFGVGQGQWKDGSAVPVKVTVNVAITARRAR